MQNLTDDIIDTANYFVNDYNKYNKNAIFDFSIKSLVFIDEELDDLYCFDFDENIICNISKVIGCYIFETARRNYGGEYKWIEDKEKPILIAGELNFFVSICAWDKVKTRLTNGKENHITFYIA